MTFFQEFLLGDDEDDDEEEEEEAANSAAACRGDIYQVTTKKILLQWEPRNSNMFGF